MPTLAGPFIPVLRVSDVTASADWYSRVLCLTEISHYSDPTGGPRQIVLTEPRSGLTLCLVADAGPVATFDEHSLGLDHLEFVVSTFDDLAHWVEHLDAQLVPHSGIKTPDYSQAAIVTFRDNDNIQLELFCSER